MAEAIQLLGSKGNLDRNGLIVITAKFLSATLADTLAWLGQVGVEMEGLPRVGADYEQSDDGQFEITATFEGLTGQAAAGDPSDTLTEYEFDGSMEKSPIQTHRKFEALKKKYGWDDEAGRFPSTTSASQASTGFAKQDSGAAESSVAGEDSYFEFGAQFLVRYARTTIPQSALKNLGTIQVPPGIEAFQIPDAGGKRNWLKMGPKIVKRGNAVKIEENYLLSGPRGWARDVYDIGQLEDDTSA